MDPRLTVEKLITPTRQQPKWEVLLDNRAIGRIEQKRIGGARNSFFEAFVFLEGETIDLEATIDFDERCDTILRAHRDPMSVLQTRDWLERRQRMAAWRASRGE